MMKYILGTLAVLALVATGVATKVVDDHFDYVRALEANVERLGGDLEEAEKNYFQLLPEVNRPAGE